MRLAFEQGEESLAHDGGIGIIHLAEEQVAAHGRIVFLRQQVVDQQHLAESGSRLSQRQGRSVG